MSSTPETSVHVRDTAVKRIFRYLKGTVDLTLQYQSGDNDELIGYSDADWANDLDSRCSTTGCVFTMTGGAVSWMNRKQQTVALSTAEAEYVALSSATQEVIWFRKLLDDLGVEVSQPTVIYRRIQLDISELSTST